MTTPPSPKSPADETPPPVGRLVHEALSKSSVLWVGATPDEAVAAWFAYHDEQVLLVTGPGEQPLPFLGDEASIVLRGKDSRARLAALPCAVRVLPVDDPAWPDAAAALAAERLNADVLPAELPQRWADTGVTVLALAPDLERADVTVADTTGGHAPPRGRSLT